MTMPTTVFARGRWIVGIAVVLAIVSMLLYPGGTTLDPSPRGYSRWQNFLSDLGMTVAYDHRPNRLGAKRPASRQWVKRAQRISARRGSGRPEGRPIRRVPANAHSWTIERQARGIEHQCTVPRTAHARAVSAIAPPGPRRNVASSLRARSSRRSASSDATYEGAGPVPPRKGCQ